MRYATVALRWEDADRPIGAVLAHDDAVRVEAVRDISPGPDDTFVQLLELSGDAERARDLLADAPDVLEYDVTGAHNGGLAYLHCRAAGLIADLLRALHDHGIVVDWPMYPLDENGADGADPVAGLEVRVLGSDRTIQTAASALPAAVELTLERTGEYGGPGRLAGALTERQRELFERAVREGYYEVPRRTTHRELAEKLGVSTATVSEHLQRVESKLVDEYVESG